MEALYAVLAHLNDVLGHGLDLVAGSTMTQVGLGALIAGALGAVGLMATRHFRN